MVNKGIMENFIQELSQVVRFHRKRSGLSQKRLGELAGLGKTVIYDLEHQKSTIKLSTLLCVLRVLNLQLHLESPLMSEYKGIYGTDG